MSVRDTIIERDAWRASVLTKIPVSVLGWASVLAAVVGLAYGLSPTAAWFAVAMFFLLRWAGDELPERERRWVVSALIVAIAIRVLVIAGLALTTDRGQQSFVTFFGDERYAIARSMWIRNVFIGVPIAPLDFIEAFSTNMNYGETAYYPFLAFLHLLAGPAPYGARLLSVALFLTGAVLLYKLVRRSYGPLPALGVLITLLLFPSLLMWSISTLKESVYFFFMSAALAGIIAVVRENRWFRRLAAVMVALGAIGAIAALRSGGFAIAMAGFAAGLAAWTITRRRWILAIAVAGMLASPVVASRVGLQELFAGATEHAVIVHLGHWRTPGSTYRLLDSDFYVQSPGVVDTSIGSMSTAARARFFLRAGLAFVLVPVPWHIASIRDLLLFPQQVLWYALVIAVPFGFIAGLRRDALLTFLLAGTIVAGVAVIAPNSGNVGTLIRHRDMVTPFVIALSAPGVQTVLLWLASLPKRSGRATRDANDPLIT